eukprot:TRINITY_DN1359_c0_g1_i1.p1 TRINITY_DN1359_c0_g1~~TRINITY_DN1359_c0_g1_i1.p1  ORF type:complete len:257 (-),score=56.51 TRINITY_DN1359_c0_g1_i1:44-814(-)
MNDLEGEKPAEGQTVKEQQDIQPDVITLSDNPEEHSTQHEANLKTASDNPEEDSTQHDAGSNEGNVQDREKEESKSERSLNEGVDKAEKVENDAEVDLFKAMEEKVHISTSQYEDFMEVFRYYDTDENQILEREELGPALRSLGFHPSNARIKDFLDEEVKDRLINEKIYLHILRIAISEKDTKRDIEEAWKVFDKEGSGRIDTKTLRHNLISIGERLSTHEADHLITLADPDNTGWIVKDYFINLMTSPPQRPFK